MIQQNQTPPSSPAHAPSSPATQPGLPGRLSVLALAVLLGAGLWTSMAQADLFNDVLQGLKNRAVEAVLKPEGQEDAQAADPAAPPPATAPASQGRQVYPTRGRYVEPAPTPMTDAVFAEMQLPLGTEVGIGGVAIQRVLSQPSLAAQPVVACDSEVYKQTSLPNRGRFVIRGYATSVEKPGESLRALSQPYAQEFTAYWAQVQHVPVKSHVPWLTFQAETCKGWVRVDSQDTYHGGTGDHPYSRLASWKRSYVPPELLDPKEAVTVKKSGWLRDDPRDMKRVVCNIYPGDRVRVLETYTQDKAAKVLLLSAKSMDCQSRLNQRWFISLSLLND